MHSATVITLILAAISCSLVHCNPKAYIPCCGTSSSNLWPSYGYGYYGYPGFTSQDYIYPEVGWTGTGYGYGYGYGYGQCPDEKQEDCSEFHSGRLCTSGTECGSNEACCQSSCVRARICKTIKTVTHNAIYAVCPTIFNCEKWEEAHKGKNWDECKVDGDCKNKERCCANPCQSKKLCQDV